MMPMITRASKPKLIERAKRAYSRRTGRSTETVVGTVRARYLVLHDGDELVAVYGFSSRAVEVKRSTWARAVTLRWLPQSDWPASVR